MKFRWRVAIVTFSTALSLLLLMGAVLGQEKTSPDPYRPLAVLSEVLARIESDYVEDPNFTQVTEGALHGMLESLDPYSSYLTPQEYEAYQKRRQQEAGIGAVVSKRFGYVSLVTVFPGSPADQAGLRAGDVIESIEGRTTREMSLVEVNSQLEGAKGSAVRLSVVRERASEPKPLTLTRQVTVLPEVEGRLLDSDIGYIRVAAFPEGTSEKIADWVRQLRRRGAARFIVDLRDNAYGEVEEGVKTANLFLRRGLISYLEGQQFPRKSFVADSGKTASEEPLAVLVNASTGGAAEIVAAAMLDNHRGGVVGERTYGIGSVQKLIPLDDGSALLLSVAKYFTPTGTEIQENGVAPSVPVEQEREFVALPEGGEPVIPPKSKKPEEDTLLQRAIEWLRAQQNQPKAA